MSTISIRVSEDERTALNGFARLRGINLSQLIRNTVFERLEEEYDEMVIQEYRANPPESFISMDEMLKKYA